MIVSRTARRLGAASHCTLILCCLGCAPEQTGVGDLPTQARAADGQFISWREHLIDDAADISGSDGLVMADIDGDGNSTNAYIP